MSIWNLIRNGIRNVGTRISRGIENTIRIVSRKETLEQEEERERRIKEIAEETRRAGIEEKIKSREKEQKKETGKMIEEIKEEIKQAKEEIKKEEKRQIKEEEKKLEKQREIEQAKEKKKEKGLVEKQIEWMKRRTTLTTAKEKIHKEYEKYMNQGEYQELIGGMLTQNQIKSAFEKIVLSQGGIIVLDEEKKKEAVINALWESREILRDQFSAIITFNKLEGENPEEVASIKIFGILPDEMEKVLSLYEEGSSIIEYGELKELENRIKEELGIPIEGTTKPEGGFKRFTLYNMDISMAFGSGKQ